MDIPYGSFTSIFEQIVLRPLLEYCAEQVVFVMQYALENNADGISTTSLQDCVKYDMSGNQATIYIDYELCQSLYEDMPVMEAGKVVEWGRFINVFGDQKGDNEWNGEIIAFRMAQWLEQGAYGTKGNNPILPTHWFTQIVAKEVNKNLRYWIEKFFTINGIPFRRISTKGA